MREQLDWLLESEKPEHTGLLDFEENLSRTDEVSDSLLERDLAEIVESAHEERSLGEDLADPELFATRAAGDYTYTHAEWGKAASGILELCDDPERDALAQREAGGDERRLDDDGGHLIGARFGGAPGSENLDAQNRQVNRGDYKAVENSWARSLEDGDQVFVDVETFKTEGSDRPAAFMGYSITEHSDGSRVCETFLLPNESKTEQALWGEGDGTAPTQADLDAAETEAEYTDGIEIDEGDQES